MDSDQNGDCIALQLNGSGNFHTSNKGQQYSTYMIISIFVASDLKGTETRDYNCVKVVWFDRPWLG
jgi:hypothetical protein